LALSYATRGEAVVSPRSGLSAIRSSSEEARTTLSFGISGRTVPSSICMTSRACRPCHLNFRSKAANRTEPWSTVSLAVRTCRAKTAGTGSLVLGAIVQRQATGEGGHRGSRIRHSIVRIVSMAWHCRHTSRSGQTILALTGPGLSHCPRCAAICHKLPQGSRTVARLSP